jgi:hypothetical protein
VVKLIAEIDGDGNVAALWRAGRGVRSPRPVGTGRDEIDAVLTLLEEAEISGATHAVVRIWLENLR